jgi:membrane-associated phospholipid phosphatase
MTGDREAREAALLSLESGTIALGETYGLKLLTHRSRPKTGAGPDEWDGINGSFADRNLSFPSAHAALAFSTATVFAAVYEDHRWVPYVAYTMATCTALSRINDNEHWSSDVFFGSVLGWYTAKSILDNHGAEAKADLTIQPFIVDQGLGLSVNYRF